MINNSSHHIYVPSFGPWPLICTVNGTSMVTSLFIIIKFQEIILAAIAVSLTVLSTLYWWSLYINELNQEGCSTAKIDSALNQSMILFISSEVAFFLSFFWAYSHGYLSPEAEVTPCSWPSSEVEFFEWTSVPAVNTMILMSSGVTVTVAHHYISEESPNNTSIFLLATILLGAAFTSVQLKEYAEAYFGVNDGAFGSCFFSLTGFHGIHVLVGTIYLTYAAWTLNFTTPNDNTFVSAEIAAWYWHFVDVIWMFLFYLLYYLNQ